jgi:hypothetical protein
METEEFPLTTRKVKKEKTEGLPVAIMTLIC